MSTAPEDFAPPPPDSWPGAGGRRSVAPAPDARPRGADSWPGARGSRPAKAPAAAAQSASGGDLNVSVVLMPALVVLAALILLGVWTMLDDGHRALQALAFALTLLLGLVGLVLTLVKLRRS